MAITAKAKRLPSEVRVGVLVYEGCSAWIVAGILELFEIANVLPRQTLESRQVTRFRLETVSPLGQKVIATNGIRFDSVHSRLPLDVLIVPPVWHQSAAHLAEALKSLSPMLSRLPALVKRSRIISSACSGAVLLAEAGLLEGKTATTCWWLSEWFKTRYPTVRLTPERLIVVDGQTWTAAAGSAYVHLGLKIVESFAGKELAAMTAKFLLAEPNRGTQAPYLSPGLAHSDLDSPLGALRAFVLNRIEHSIRLSELAAAGNMSVRSLFRYFEKTKGTTPLEFVQSMRVERAKRLLELTQESVDSITPKCGYEDVSSFRKLFRRQVGMTPKEYRQRFGRFVQ